MKKEKRVFFQGFFVVFILFMLIGVLPVFASDDKDSVISAEFASVKLDVNTSIKLGVFSQPVLNYVQADIIFIPLQSDNQKLKSFVSQGSLLKDRLVFIWSNPQVQNFEFGYSALVDVYNNPPKVKNKLPFPFRIKDQFEFLQRTDVIDFDSPGIIKLADDLSEGEDDLFLVVSKFGEWVKNNVKYDLNTLTASVSNPASWVLENKIGVCDEITTLFIALLRAKGIPAKFISGVAYTNNPEFPNRWGPHGWAEVYFPGTGWVPFDITFGQFGWVDPGHVKLKEGVDPQEPTTKLEWKGRGVSAEIDDLSISAGLVGMGGVLKNPLSLELMVEYSKVGFGSYNVLEVGVENIADYYVAVELSLAKVKELETDVPTKLVVLKPKEQKLVFWKVKVSDGLNENYQYDIPLKIYDSKNKTEKISMTASAQDIVFSENDIDNIINNKKIQVREQKVKEIVLGCVPEKQTLEINEKTIINCAIENYFSVEKKINICLNEEDCKEEILLKESRKEVSFEYLPEKTGVNEATISIKSEKHETKTTMTIIKLDEANLEITGIKIPQNLNYGDKFAIEFTIKKTSMANPKNVTATIAGNGAKTVIPIDDLSASQNFVIDIDTKKTYSKDPVFVIRVEFEQSSGKNVFVEKKIGTSISGMPFWKAIIGWMLNIF